MSISSSSSSRSDSSAFELPILSQDEHRYAQIPAEEMQPESHFSFFVRNLPPAVTSIVFSYTNIDARDLNEYVNQGSQAEMQNAILMVPRFELEEFPEGSFIRRRWETFCADNGEVPRLGPIFLRRFRGSVASEIRLDRAILPEAVWARVAPVETVPEHWSLSDLDRVGSAIEEHKDVILISFIESMMNDGSRLVDQAFQEELLAILDLPLTDFEKARRLRECLNQDGRNFQFLRLSFSLDLPGFPPELVPFLERIQARHEQRLAEVIEKITTRAALLGNREFLERVILVIRANREALPSSALDEAFIAVCKEGKPLQSITILLGSGLISAETITRAYREAAASANAELVKLLIVNPQLSKFALWETWYWSSIPSSVLNTLFPMLVMGPAQLFAVSGGGAPQILIPTMNTIALCLGYHWSRNPAPCFTRACICHTTPCTQAGRETHQIISSQLFGPSQHNMIDRIVP